MPRLLNYITSPQVLIRSAVVASCSMPTLFQSSALIYKNTQGQKLPWNTSLDKWIDGSVDGDIPIKRLSEMFNVNHCIVSQVNPHINIFLQLKNSESKLLNSFLYLTWSECLYRLKQIANLGIFTNILMKTISIFEQRYEGDITIVPKFGIDDYLRTLSKTTPEFVHDAIIKGARATWPKMDMIRNQCLVEQTLDRIIFKLRESQN